MQWWHLHSFSPLFQASQDIFSVALWHSPRFHWRGRSYPLPNYFCNHFLDPPAAAACRCVTVLVVSITYTKAPGFGALS